MLEGAEVRLAVDIGGTFTDIVLDVGQDRKTRKVLTTPQRPEQAVLDMVQLLMDEEKNFSNPDKWGMAVRVKLNEQKKPSKEIFDGPQLYR